jgi:integrase
MKTELKIKNPSNPKLRGYVEFYLDGKRIREYTGRSINLEIEPNSEKEPERRLELLYELKISLAKYIAANNYPAKKIPTLPITKEEDVPKPAEEFYTIEKTLKMALDGKHNMHLSRKYKEDLKVVHDQFVNFLSKEELKMKYEAISVMKIEEFLSQFSSSGTYYMKKRSDLSILFSAGAKLIGSRSIARNSHTERSKAKLHKAYEKPKMRKLLSALKQYSPELHLCCLFTYGCWLRPHVEVLSLTKRQFKNNYTEVHLSGSENKGGSVRIVYVPEYVQEVIIPILEGLEMEMNIFSRSIEVLNRFYFTTKWKRLRKVLIAKQLIEDGQTIYSFRHTAAVEIYKRTKDIYLLQRLMGHSSIGVTQKYLRSLGVVNIEELKSSAPTL